MELAFNSLELRDICETHARAVELLGLAIAEELEAMIADIHVATNVEDLGAGYPDVTAEHLILEVNDAVHLVLVPNHPNPRLTEGGGIDWNAVSRVRVVELRVE